MSYVYIQHYSTSIIFPSIAKSLLSSIQGRQAACYCQLFGWVKRSPPLFVTPQAVRSFAEYLPLLLKKPGFFGLFLKREEPRKNKGLNTKKTDLLWGSSKISSWLTMRPFMTILSRPASVNLQLPWKLEIYCYTRFTWLPWPPRLIKLSKNLFSGPTFQQGVIVLMTSENILTSWHQEVKKHSSHGILSL